MAITARDIHEKEFSHAMRGYKESEVDDFLDLCAAEVDRLTRENNALKEHLEQERRASASMGAVPAPVVEVAEVTEVREVSVSRVSASEIGDVLLLAQNTADELVSKAHAQADKILSAAEGRASEIVGEAATKKREIMEMAKVLKSAEVDFRDRYRAMLEQSLADIREITMEINMDADELYIAPIDQVITTPEPVIERPVAAVADVVEIAEPTDFEPVTDAVVVETTVSEPKIVEPAPFDPGILESTSFIDQVEFDEDEIEEID
ncbi:MAG: DivIVA domain-containing protein [Actinomycetia bacterium]|nr:DivIVA domain-containing protein [Actinomycetes bacterium]